MSDSDKFLRIEKALQDTFSNPPCGEIPANFTHSIMRDVNLLCSRESAGVMQLVEIIVQRCAWGSCGFALASALMFFVYFQRAEPELLQLTFSDPLELIASEFM